MLHNILSMKVVGMKMNKSSVVNYLGIQFFNSLIGLAGLLLSSTKLINQTPYYLRFKL